MFAGLPCKRLQLDGVWGFVGAKAKNADRRRQPANRATQGFGLRLALKSNWVPSWLVGGRDSDAIVFTDDLAGRLAYRDQTISDGPTTAAREASRRRTLSGARSSRARREGTSRGALYGDDGHVYSDTIHITHDPVVQESAARRALADQPVPGSVSV